MRREIIEILLDTNRTAEQKEADILAFVRSELNNRPRDK